MSRPPSNIGALPGSGTGTMPTGPSWNSQADAVSFFDKVNCDAMTLSTDQGEVAFGNCPTKTWQSWDNQCVPVILASGSD